MNYLSERRLHYRRNKQGVWMTCKSFRKTLISWIPVHLLIWLSVLFHPPKCNTPTLHLITYTHWEINTQEFQYYYGIQILTVVGLFWFFPLVVCFSNSRVPRLQLQESIRYLNTPGLKRRSHRDKTSPVQEHYRVQQLFHCNYSPGSQKLHIESTQEILF